MSELEDVPELRNPVAVAAFEGWNDAADAASGVVQHLVEQWDADLIAELDPDDYYDFQVNRPHVGFGESDEGPRRREITWPTTRVFVVRVPEAPRDLVLIHGIEPNMRWRQFCEELLGLLSELGVETLVTLGALLADAPHTRPVPVSGTTSDAETGRALGLEQTTYEGPTGITGVLQDLASGVELPSVSLWAAVPHYVSSPPCPKATLALLRRLEDFLDVPVPLGELPEEARAWQRGVDELASQDTEIAEYVSSLEEAKDTAELPEASGDAIAREFERYLRRRDRDQGR